MKFVKHLGALPLVLLPTLVWANDASTSTGAAAPAVVHPDGGADVILPALKLLASAYREHQWALLAGLLLTFVVIGLRMFSVVQKLPDALVPWATIGMGLLGAAAVGLQTGESWDAIVMTGLAVGVAAIGGWETVGKLLRGLAAKLRGAPAPEPTPPPPAEPPKEG